MTDLVDQLLLCCCRPRISVQRIANLNIALQFLEDQRIRLVNIRAEDIEKGNLKIILGLMWTIILRFQIQKNTKEVLGDSQISTVPCNIHVCHNAYSTDLLSPIKNQRFQTNGC